MRHRKSGRALGRTAAHRKALTRNQVTDLIRYGRLVTTEAKAKELRSAAERAITLGKRGDLHARRQAGALMTDRRVLRHLFETLGPTYRERRGGYTRITKLGPRLGDGAEMAQIELVAEIGLDDQAAQTAVADAVPAPSRDSTVSTSAPAEDAEVVPEPVDEQSSDAEDVAGAAELEETAAPPRPAEVSTEDDAPAAEGPAEAPDDEKV